MPAKTIDEVVSQLDDIIARSRREQSRLGYFAALYRNVTLKVRDGVAAGRFEDNARMERLDVIFANRYLDALEQYRRREPTSRCWLAAFRAAETWPPIVLQHLLLGINAHINLDLGIAAAETSPGDQLPGLAADFNAINDILCAMIDDVQDRLARVSSWMMILDRAGCRNDEAVMNFSINRAREQAWAAAQRVAAAPPDRLPAVIDELDDCATLIAGLVNKAGLKFQLAGLAVRLSELRDVRQVIDVLS